MGNGDGCFLITWATVGAFSISPSIYHSLLLCVITQFTRHLLLLLLHTERAIVVHCVLHFLLAYTCTNSFMWVQLRCHFLLARQSLELRWLSSSSSSASACWFFRFGFAPTVELKLSGCFRHPQNLPSTRLPPTSLLLAL